MLTRLKIQNFRSIADQEIEIGPLTILYGPNASGKSSVFYALLALKNLVLNPNQPTDAFFNLGFVNLGGFEQVVHKHRTDAEIVLGLECWHDRSSGEYAVALRRGGGGLSLLVGEPSDATLLKVNVTFPYPGNMQDGGPVSRGGATLDLRWNGILAQVGYDATAGQQAEQRASELAALANLPAETLRKTDVAPRHRGFSKPHYGQVPLPITPLTEDEVATALAMDPYLEGRVNVLLEDVFGQALQVRNVPGTALFYLQTIERTWGTVIELVNEGFGLNQVAYLSAKVLRQDAAVVCIEEPEIHLHPSAQSRLVHVLGKIAKEEGKQFIISTHSDHVVSALLAEVAKGDLSADDVYCYLCTKTPDGSKFERQRVQSNGQIEGGLASFMEAESEHLKALLRLESETE